MKKQDTSEQWESFMQNFILFLKGKDLKFTNQRKALALWVFNHHEHFTAEDLVIAFQSERWVSKATIYRTLSLLVEAGILVEENFNEGYKTYEFKFNRKHHDHLICQECGKVIEFENKEIEKLQEKVALEYGYILQSHTLKLFGLCSVCQRKGRPRRP